MKSTTKSTLGIDLGTTNCGASLCDGSATPIRLKFASEGSQLETAVYTDGNGTSLVGRKARLAAFKHPERVHVQFKRLIPISPDDPVCPGGPTPVQLSAYPLAHILKTCLQNFPHIEQAIADGTCKIVVTHPASYRTVDQQALHRAAQLVGDGFRIDEFFSEPVAGSLFFRRQHPEKLREDDLILVIDVGGGTTDNTILRYTNGVCDEQVADRGDARLGGINFTGPLFQHFCQALGYDALAGCFDPDSGLSLGDQALPVADRRLAAALWDKCDRLKIALGSDESAEEFLESPQGLQELSLTRNEFYRLTDEAYRRFDVAVGDTLVGTPFTWTDINHVVLIGGSAGLPSLRERVAQLTQRSEAEVYVDTDSENVVSDGAAYLGYSGESTAQVLPGGCGVRVHRVQGQNGHASREVLYKMFFRPGHVISSAGETVESLGQFIDASGGDCTIELELCEAKPGVQVDQPGDGTLPLLTPDHVVPIHSVRRTCQVPAGRHEVLLGFDYSGRHLKYRFSFKDQPDLEVISGTVTSGSDNQGDETATSSQDVAILLDCSTSMRADEKLTQAKEAVRSLLGATEDGERRAALVSFGKRVELQCSLTSDFNIIRQAVDDLVASGGTPMDLALQLGTQELAGRGSGRDGIIVLVSDGQPNNAADAKARSIEARESGIRIVTVGVGNDVAEDLLQYHIASSPRDYFFASSAFELVGIFQTIADLYIN